MDDPGIYTKREQPLTLQAVRELFLDDHWVEEARIVVTLEQARKIVRALQTEIDKDMQVAPADSGHPR